MKNGRADWQRAWESEVGTTHQSDFETVTRHYIVDYLSEANRDIMVTEDGSYTTRYVYDENGKRISAEFGYAENTQRGAAGENLQSDFASELHKVWYRTSLLNSTLFAVDANGDVVAHMIYDAWANPLTETYTDTNYSGLENLNNFTGYTWDETLGLYFAQNRFYDAAAHRFTQEDVVKDGANWYVYCGNNPCVNVDVWGEKEYPIYSNGVHVGDIKNSDLSDKNYFWVGEIIPAAGGTAEYIKSSNKTVLSFNGYTATVYINTINKATDRTMSVTLYKNGTSSGKLTVKYVNKLFNDKLYVNVDELNKYLPSDKKLQILSGSELPYAPTSWNKSGVQERTNCYAYALDMKTYADGKSFLSRDEANYAQLGKAYPFYLDAHHAYQYYCNLICAGYKSNQITFALQPGVYSGKILTGDIVSSVSKFYDFCYEDMVANPAIKVQKVTATQTLPAGYYRICLVARKYETMDTWDYHWYRQNSDGTWSHKPGQTAVTNKDNSGNLIFDPAIADRGGYVNVIGYYAVKKV